MQEAPHFRSGVTSRDIYGERMASDMVDEMTMGGAGGGGGLPWFRRSPSPYNPNSGVRAPNTPRTPRAQDQRTRTQDRTPTDTRTGAGAKTMAIPWWSIASKGVDTLFGIYGSRKQDAADRRSTDYLRTRDAEALAWDRELEARRRMEHDAEQAERRQQWDAMQKFEAAKWAAMEEERLHARALADAKEARQAPYRAASLSALNNLPSLWASGAQSPGLGSLGSYRGGGE